MSKVIVTGGAGFIGSNLVDSLLAMGKHVIVIDNESSPNHEQFYWNDQSENYKLDLTNYDDIKDLFVGVDCVFHLAAKTSIPESVDHPREHMLNNLVSTVNVLEAARNAGVKRVVYSTTSAYYGNNNPIPNKEDQPEDTLNGYSISKVTGDKICKMYSNLYGMETIALRYFNVYGNRQPKFGSYVPAIGIFMDLAKQGKTLTVNGDGENVRDFINVADVVRANVMASEAVLEAYGEVFNVGTGVGRTINQIAEMISSDIIHGPAKPGEVRYGLADITKIKQTLGWEPQVFVDDWIKDNL